MNDDPELTAMNAVYSALKEIDESARARVLGWAANRFSVTPAKKLTVTSGGATAAEDSSAPKKLTDFATVSDCFAAAKPESTADKALVVAAYLQEIKGGNDITGRDINKELTHMGHGVGNITRALEPLIGSKPQLLIQTRKEGKTRQAQKKYRVTNEGFTQVSAWLAGTAGE